MLRSFGRYLPVLVAAFWFASVSSPYGEGWSFPPATFHQFGPFGTIGDCDDVRAVIVKGAKGVSVSKCWNDKGQPAVTLPPR